MIYFKLVIILLILSSCITRKFPEEQYPLNEIYLSYVNQLHTTDTAIIYLGSCSGCTRGIEKNLYIFRKKNNSTILKRFSNFLEYDSLDIYFDWKYFIDKYEILKDEEIEYPRSEYIENGKKYILEYSPCDHGRWDKLYYHIGDSILVYNILPCVKGCNEENQRVIVIDKLRSILLDKNQYWRPVNFKYKKRRKYN